MQATFPNRHMLTRESLLSGRYLDSLELPLEFRWTQDRIDTSLAEAMSARPDEGDDLWIFAYGSLMWNPLLDFDRRSVAPRLERTRPRSTFSWWTMTTARSTAQFTVPAHPAVSS